MTNFTVKVHVTSTLFSKLSLPLEDARDFLL